MSLVAFLFGTAGKSAAVGTTGAIIGLIGPQAAVSIAVVGGVLAAPVIFKATNFVGNLAVRTVVTTAQVAVKTVVKTYDIIDNVVDVLVTSEKGSSNQANSKNNQNYHNNKENKRENPNTQTQHTNNTRSDGTDCTGGPGGDDPRKPNHNPIPVTSCRNPTTRSRRNSANFQDEDSDNIHRHTGYTHLKSRVINGVRFGGEVKRVSEVSNQAVTSIIHEGASNFQAGYIKPEHPDSNMHRAHTIRIKLDNIIVETLFPILWKLLTDHAGHTQWVPKTFNIWGKIAQRFDNLQYGWIVRAARANFPAGKTPENLAIFESIKQDILKVYDDELSLHAWKYTEEELNEIRKARTWLENVTSGYLFEKALEGYNLEHTYDNPRRRL